MRLKREECHKLAQLAGNAILKDPKNKLKGDRNALFKVIESVLAMHFEEERVMEEEAKSLYLNKGMAVDGMERGKAINLILKQIAKKKNFVLSGGAMEGRFTEDKIMHLAHIVADKIYDDDIFDFEDEDAGSRDLKKIFMQYFKKEAELDQKVRKKLASLSKAPFEGSDAWETLYRKYFEEEKLRIGHE